MTTIKSLLLLLLSLAATFMSTTAFVIPRQTTPDCDKDTSSTTPPNVTKAGSTPGGGPSKPVYGANPAHGSPTEAKDAAGGAGILVLVDLKKINTAVTILTTKVTSYKGGLAASVPLGKAQKIVDIEIEKCAEHVSIAHAFSEADAQAAVTYVSNTLAVSISAALSAITSKKSLFVEAKLTSIVAFGLKAMRTDIEALKGAMKTKLPASQQQAAVAVFTKICESITVCITTYSETSGGTNTTVTAVGAGAGAGAGVVETGGGMTGGGSTEQTKGVELSGKETAGGETTESNTTPVQKPEEQKPKEQKPEEQKPEEQKPEEQKPEEQKPEEVKPVEVKPEEVKPEELKTEQATPPPESTSEETTSKGTTNEQLNTISLAAGGGGGGGGGASTEVSSAGVKFGGTG
ncbi:cell wall anchor protein, partial [Teratosphaeria destructans]